MRGIYITHEELAALHGCGPLAAFAYVWLRSWMDIDTGMVGVSRALSRQMVISYCETHVPRGNGVQVVQATLKEYRCAMDRLGRAGLIVRKGGADVVVFKLPLAQTLSLAQNEQGRVRAGNEGREQGREQGLGKSSKGVALEVIQGREQGREQGRGKKAIQGLHQRSEIKASTPPAASTELSEGRADEVSRFAAEWSAARSVTPDSAGDEVGRIAIGLAVAVRQSGGKVTASDPRVRRWAEQGVTVGQVQAAVDIAQQRRQADGSLQPVGAGYLDAILRDVLKPPEPKAPPWWSSDQLMAAKACEVGIAGARPGETLEQFRGRITEALRRAQGVGA